LLKFDIAKRPVYPNKILKKKCVFIILPYFCIWLLLIRWQWWSILLSFQQSY